jgi:hypothetical protein
VRDQGGDIWVGEDIEEDLLGDFPYPLGFFPLQLFWIGLWWGICVRGSRTLKKTTLGR